MSAKIQVNCSKCDGTGCTPFRHVEGGKCFRCRGTGKFWTTQAEADRMAKEAALSAANIADEYAAFDANRDMVNVMSVFAMGTAVFTFKTNSDHGTVNCGDGISRPYRVVKGDVVIPSHPMLAYRVNCQLEADTIECPVAQAEYLVSTLG